MKCKGMFCGSSSAERISKAKEDSRHQGSRKKDCKNRAGIPLHFYGFVNIEIFFEQSCHG
jgi:hypothetical protein